MNLSDKKKVVIFSIISLVLIGCIFTLVMVLIRENRENMQGTSQHLNKVYGTILQVDDDTITIEPIDESLGKKLIIENTEDYLVGDFIVLYDVKKSDDAYIAKTKEKIANVNEIEQNSPTTSKITTNATSKMTTTTKKMTTSKKNINTDEEIISYMKQANEEITKNSNETFKDKAKQTFILIVDFIFYDGEIKGITWDEISDAAKSKVVYYALIIDSKIDDTWPGYKDTFANKVDDLKARLIAKYMDLSTNICKNHPKECEITKNDFNILKKSLNLTWEVISKTFKYGYDKTTSFLKSWYEIFSGK